MALPQKKPATFASEETFSYYQPQIQYHAYFFGPFRVIRDDQYLGEPTWRRNKARALLKWFLLNPGDLFSVEYLSKLFWPDVSRKVAVSNLHVTLHYLRRVLEPELASGSTSTFIRRNRHNYYWFELNDVWWTDVLDTQRLSALAKEAERAGESRKAILLYNQLFTYYKQGFLPEDIYEDMFAPYRRQHDYACTLLLERLVQLYTEAGRFDDALSCILHFLHIDPYSESAMRMMIQIYLRQGNTTGALRQLDDFQQALKQDLGVDLGDEFLLLRNAILNAR